MKTKTKVVLLILIPVVLSLVTVTGLIWMQKEIRRGELVGRLANEIVYKVFEMDQVVSQDLLYPEERPEVQFRSIYDSLKNTLTRFPTKTAQEDQSIRKMIGNQEDIGFLFPLIIGEERKQAAAQGDRFYQEYKGQVTGQLLIKLKEIVAESFQLKKSSGDRINGNVQRVNRLIITVILLGGLAMMLLAGFIGRTILQNTKDLQREIDDRRRTEEDLRTSEERLRENEATLRGVLDAVKESIWLFSLEGLVLTGNSTAFSRFPLPPAEVIGRSVTEIMPAELAQSRLAQLGKVVEYGRALEFEDRRAGILFQHNFYPVLDEQGQVRAVVSFSRDITDRRRAEEALRESEQRFRLALRNAPVSVATQDGDLRYTWAYNQRTARAQEIIGRCDADIFTPEEAAYLTAIKRRVIEENVEVREQMWFTRPGGRIFLDVFFEPLCDEAGRVTGVGSATVDLTSLKLAEETLRASEEQYRLLFAANPSPMFVFDEETLHFLAVNDAAVRQYGWSREEFLGLTIPDIRQPEERALVPEVIRRHRGAHETRIGVFRHCRKDGTLMDMEVTASSIPFVGRPGRLCSMNDITDRRQAEETLRRSREDLDRAQAVGRIGSWRLDVRRNVLTWSDENHRIFGVPRGTPLTYETFLGAIHPDDRQYVETQWQAGLRGAPYDIEHRIVADGQEKWVREKAYLEFDEAGELLGGFGITQDITERKRSEQELRERGERLRASLGEKEVLLKEIHHRVKNNMQVISSLVSLQAEELQDAVAQAIFQDLTHRVRSMALVHEKLYQSTDLARVEFAEYTRSLLNYLWRAYGSEASGIRLNQDLEPVSLSVNTAVPFGLILNELVINALKHAFHGRSGGEVVVSLRGGAPGRVCLGVRDNGTGLPAAFDWRQSRSLGLRLVQMLAGQLHAAVEVSRDGGTEFKIAFEVQEPEKVSGSVTG